MIKALNTFLINYLVYPRHGGVRKELNVNIPFNAIEKWYELKPEIFMEKPIDSKNKLQNCNEVIIQVFLNNLVKLDR